MALLDSPGMAAHSMYSNMSSYLLQQHTNAAGNKLASLADWSMATGHNPHAPHQSQNTALLEDATSRVVARVAPSQRLSREAANNSLNSSSPNTSANNSANSGSSPSSHITNLFGNNSSPDERIPNKVFGSKADLQLHTQIHMREAKPYKCSQCNKSFANSSYLSQHTRIHLGIKPYRCEICQRKFTQLSHLQQHIRTHTGDKPYRCRHAGCTKAFSQLSNLQSHSRCHQTDKPYKCNSCYKCFIDESALLEHIPKHKESKHLKTHICQYCGKSYTQETYLAKHMQKHSDRPDKRPPIAGQPGAPGAHPTSGSGAGTGVVAAASNALSSASDAYWSKMDPTAYGHAERDYQASLMDPRLNPATHHTTDPRHHNLGVEDLRHSAGAMPVSYGESIKTSSAFSPIQGAAALNNATGFSMAGSRNYFYDPLTFSKHHSQVCIRK